MWGERIGSLMEAEALTLVHEQRYASPEGGNAGDESLGSRQGRWMVDRNRRGGNWDRHKGI